VTLFLCGYALTLDSEELAKLPCEAKAGGFGVVDVRHAHLGQGLNPAAADPETDRVRKGSHELRDPA
jgi:hypothetical protein